MRLHWTLSIAAVAGVLFANEAPAQQVLDFAGYGGSTEKTLRTKVFPPFEKKHGVKIRYTAGASTKNLARLQAQRSNPEVDVALMDSGPMQQAVSLGLCTTVADSGRIKDLYPLARHGDGRSVGLGLVATGIAYNKEMFAAEGWPAPTSWLDLANPAYKGKLLVPSITNSYGLLALVVEAQLHGGGVNDIAPGMTFMAEKVAPSVYSFETSSAKISELFQTKSIAIGVWGNGRAHALAKTGFPVAFVTPKEGAVALQTTICPIAGSDVPDLAQELVRHLLSPESQQILAEYSGWGPSNSKTTLSGTTAKAVVYGPEAVKKLIAPDWGVINESRKGWTREWSRTVEK